MTPSILLVDDDAGLLEALGRYFQRRSFETHRAATGERALELYISQRPDLVLLDVNLPDLNGLPVLRRLREADGGATVIMITGSGDIETAVEAMRIGAEDFLTKPVDLAHLGAVVDRARDRAALRKQNRALAGSGGGTRTEGTLGPSALMQDVERRVERIAAGDATVLLQGETGTGKGWLARRIHERSGRREGPFVEVNCGGLSATFLDSELFGHERGAFTDAKARKDGLLEVADGGTVFLDEIGDLAPELQPKLLKVLESRRFRKLGGTRELEVDIRLIAATNVDLAERVRAGAFREDLFYRLAVLPLELPPLRNRTPQDIAALAYRLLADLRRSIGTGPDRISDDALALFVRYGWPGNIRELRNLLERILILAHDDDEVRPEHLPEGMHPDPSTVATPDALTLAEVERRHIATVLERNEGNRSRTARALGISRAALYDKMDRFGLRSVGL